METRRAELVLGRIISLALALLIASEGVTAFMTYEGPGEGARASHAKDVKVTNKDVYKYLSKSAFAGSSITVRKKLYYKKKSRKYMGHPDFIVQRGYSILYDFSLTRPFCLTYKGRAIHMKDYIKKLKVKRVFIQMGTNEMRSGVKFSYKNYKKLLRGIRKTNPKVTIFVEATMPNRIDHGNHITPANIKRFNKMMKGYVRTQKNMYFIDIFPGMSNKKGRLRKEYAEDTIHPNPRGVRKWDRIIVRYLKNFLRNEWSGAGNDQDKIKVARKRKAKRATRITSWNKEYKKLYFNNGEIVTGVAIYKRKFYAFTKGGRYLKGKTMKIRRVVKKKRPVKAVLKLLGKPKKIVKQESCLEQGGLDGVYRYDHFILMTYTNPKGMETVQAFASKY